MRYHFRIRKERTGYWAKCIELPGCSTQADSIKSLERNMVEALNLYLDEPAESETSFPSPRKNITGKGVKAVTVEPQIAFAFLLRRSRKKRGLTQKEVAIQLGFKNLYSYQRLESSKTANPELATIIKIKAVFPEIDLEALAA